MCFQIPVRAVQFNAAGVGFVYLKLHSKQLLLINNVPLDEDNSDFPIHFDACGCLLSMMDLLLVYISYMKIRRLKIGQLWLYEGPLRASMT